MKEIIIVLLLVTAIVICLFAVLFVSVDQAIPASTVTLHPDTFSGWITYTPVPDQGAAYDIWQDIGVIQR